MTVHIPAFASTMTVVCCVAFAAQPKSTQPKKGNPPKAKTKPPKSATKSADLARWEKLDARRRAIGRKLSDLRSTFSISSRTRKLEIKKEFESLVKEWQEQIQPKMVPLSLSRLRQDPADEVAARIAEQHSKPAEVVAVTSALIKSGKDSGPILRLAGFANFAMNNFSRAVELLEKARDKDALGSFGGIGVLDGANALSNARDYVKFWEKELDLRKQEAAAKPGEQLPHVILDTTRGKIELELFENQAPNTVANFVNLVERKFYDGLRFHAVLPGRLVKTGDPNTKEKYNERLNYGTGGPGYTIDTEALKAENPRMHFRGSLSMDNLDAGIDGSIFSILLRPEPRLNRGPLRTRGNTVFGRVVSGMDVVEQLKRGDKIIKATVVPGSKRKHEYKPKTSADKEEPEKKPGPGKFPSGKEKTPPKKDTGKTPAKKDGGKKKSAPGKFPAGKEKTPPKKDSGKTPAKTDGAKTTPTKKP